MGKEQDAVVGFGVELAEDVARMEHRAVERLEVGALFLHGGPVTCQLRYKPVGGLAMRLSVGHARPEIHLTLQIGVCTVGRKLHVRVDASGSRSISVFSDFIGVFCTFRAA